MNPSTHHSGPTSSFQHMRLKVPVATDDERSFKTFDKNGGMLQDEEVGFGEALVISEINADNVYPTLAQTPHPRSMEPMPQSNRDGVGANRGDADALPGEDTKPLRTMVLRGAMGKRDRGVPPQAASLTLGGPKSIIRDDLGFLRKQNISPGVAKNEFLQRTPRVGIDRLDGPQASGDPPSVLTLERVQLRGMGAWAEEV